MALIDDFKEDLAGIVDPVYGLGVSVVLDGKTINAIPKYETDVDDNGVKFEVLILSVLRSDYDGIPGYRAVAVVEGRTWYFWRQDQGSTLARRLRFRSNERYKV
jgi:hypothetical protein